MSEDCDSQDDKSISSHDLDQESVTSHDLDSVVTSHDGFGDDKSHDFGFESVTSDHEEVAPVKVAKTPIYKKNHVHVSNYESF